MLEGMDGLGTVACEKDGPSLDSMVALIFFAGELPSGGLSCGPAESVLCVDLRGIVSPN